MPSSGARRRRRSSGTSKASPGAAPCTATAGRKASCTRSWPTASPRTSSSRSTSTGLFAKLDEIKPDIAVWWTTGDQSQQIFRDEEVAIGILWDGRAYGLPKQGVDVEVSHDGSPITRDLFVVPADAPNPDAAFAFLEWYATNPEAEAKWAELMNYGVASPRAFDFIPEEIARTLATYPANLEVSVPVDVAWVAEHREAGLKRWTDWLGK